MERLCELWKPRFAAPERLGCAEQRVRRPFVVGKPGVDEPLAHPRGAEPDRSGADRFEQLAEQQGRVRELPGAPPVDPHCGAEGGRPQPADGVGEPGDLARPEGVVVNDVKGMVGALDVEPREGAPRSSHRIEVRSAALAEPVYAGEGGAQPPSRLLRILGMGIRHAHRSDREGRLAADAAPPDLDELEAPASEIAHDPRRPRHPGHHPERGQPCLLGAVENPDACAADPLDVLDQPDSVVRVAHRRGRDELGVAYSERGGETHEAHHRPRRLAHGLPVQMVAAGETAAERAEHAFVVERHEGVLQPIEDREPDGIRADVDHGHRTGMRGPRNETGGGLHQARAARLLVRCFPRAAPCPERLGWRMK